MIGHRRYRRLVDEMFGRDGKAGRELSDEGRQRLVAHLRGERCARCRAYYDDRRRASGHEDDETLAPAESRAILSVLDERLARLAGEPGTVAAAPAVANVPRRKAFGWKWISIAAPLAAGIAATILIVRSPADPETMPDSNLPQIKAGSPPSADYYCQPPGKPDRLLSPGEPCEVGATIRVLAYAQAGLPAVNLVVCDHGLRCRVMPAERSTGGDASVTSPPLPLLDKVYYFVVWSPEGIADRHVSRAVDSLKSDGRCVHDVDQLPIKGNDAQFSFWIRPKRVKPN